MLVGSTDSVAISRGQGMIMPRTSITLRDLYERLRAHFGAAADPETWWPIFHGVTQPPEFERVITNILVQSGSWKPVQGATAALYREHLLTAVELSRADEAVIANCVKPTGLQVMKAKRLKTIGRWVVERYGTEAAFCASVTREDLLSVAGIGPETADRILLYSCRKRFFPVDAYCVRVLARYGVIPQEPNGAADRRNCVAAIQHAVQHELAEDVEDWRRLHALMQLEGERLRRDGPRLE
jgi:endonuclease-3 related protein